MAQHDYNIANQSFPAFRADLNAVLGAVQSLNSGQIPPVNAQAGMFWLDTASAQVKMYDGAQWNTLFPLQTAGLVGRNGSNIYAADVGSANAYAVNLTPVLPSYGAGQVVHFKAATENTGASTLNVNGIGAIALKKNGGAELEAGDISAGLLVSAMYDGVTFQMMTPTAKASAGGVKSIFIGQNGFQTVGAEVLTKIAFGDEAGAFFDPYDWWDGVSQFRFQPDEPGRYAIALSWAFAEAEPSAYTRAEIKQNGLTVTPDFWGASGFSAGSYGGKIIHHANYCLPMNGTSDYLEFFVEHDMSAPYILMPYDTYLMIQKLGA